MSVDRGRLGRATCLLAFALLIGRLLATGAMAKYMTPALDLLSAITGVALAAMAVLEVRGALRRGTSGAGGPERPGASSSHDGLHVRPVAARLEQSLTVLLVLAPVTLGLLVAPRALGSGALGGEQVAGLLLAFAPGSGLTPGGAPGSAPGPTLEDVGALLAHLRRVGEAGVGRRVRVRGMVARSDALAPNELALLRYAIAHCVADARPLALLVVAPVGAGLAAGGQWVPDTWIEVDGVIAARQRDRDRLITVVADRITPIEEPENPYLAATY